MGKGGLQPDHASRDAKVIAASEKSKARFWARVDKTETCWLWDTASGFVYGQFYVNGVSMASHRVAKLWESGLPKKNLFCCHFCRNKNCVNPDHTYWGTPKENVADRARDSTDNLGVRHPLAKINEDLASYIWEQYRDSAKSQRQLSAELNLAEGLIASIIKKQTWAHVTSKLLPMPEGRRKKSYPRGEGHHMATMKMDRVLAIKRLLSLGARQGDIAIASGLHKTVIQRLASQKTWSHLDAFDRKLIEKDAVTRIALTKTCKEPSE